jgi:tetratricopeptide (TPR) repeat protein
MPGLRTPIRRGTAWTLAGLAIPIILAVSAPAPADFQLQPAGPTPAVEVDAASRAIPEVDRAIKAFEAREFDASLKLLVEAVKNHPDLPPANVIFARLAFAGHQPGLIRPALERAAIEAPGHPEVYILFGNVALLEGRTTDAAVHFEKAGNLAATGGWPPARRQRFELFRDQGVALVAEARGDPRGASAALARWLAQEPANARARQRLGKALFQIGQVDEARKELERAAKDDPALEPPAVSLGWLYARSGDPKKAGEWMDYAVKAAPNSVATRMGVAAWLLEQGRGDEAKAQAEAASKLDPDSAEARRLVGLAARQRKDLAEAERAFADLAARSPGDARARNQLALVLAEQADESKRRRALELAELSVRLDPKGVDALSTLGTVYYHLHRLDDADTVLQAVIASGQGSSDTAYTLARVRADRGHPDAAPALLKTALDAPGLFIARKDARQWLDRLVASPPK